MAEMRRAAVGLTSNFAKNMLLNSEEISFDLGALLLRISAGGALFMNHGFVKLQNFQARLESFSDPIGLGSATSFILILFAESLCALLVVLGLWTRAATIPVIIGMAVIVFIVDAGQPFAARETAFLLLMAFLAILFMGSGRYSLGRLKFR